MLYTLILSIFAINMYKKYARGGGGAIVQMRQSKAYAMSILQNPTARQSQNTCERVKS